MKEKGRDIVIEVRCYRLEPGTSARFHALFEDEVRPLLKAHGIRVARAEHTARTDEPEDADYVLVRAFESLEERARLETAFYGSEGWRSGPRSRVLQCIEDHRTSVLMVPRAVADLLTR